MKKVLLWFSLASLVFAVSCHRSISPERVQAMRSSLDSTGQNLVSFRSFYSTNAGYFSDFKSYILDSTGGQAKAQFQADSAREHQWARIQQRFQEWQVSGQVLSSEWQILLDETDSWLKRAKNDQLAETLAEKRWEEGKAKLDIFLQDGRDSAKEWDSIEAESDSLASAIKLPKAHFFSNPKGFKPILSF